VDEIFFLSGRRDAIKVTRESARKTIFSLAGSTDLLTFQFLNVGDVIG
jgi:hypothetical protein